MDTYLSLRKFCLSIVTVFFLLTHSFIEQISSLYTQQQLLGQPLDIQR